MIAAQHNIKKFSTGIMLDGRLLFVALALLTALMLTLPLQASAGAGIDEVLPESYAAVTAAIEVARASDEEAAGTVLIDDVADEGRDIMPVEDAIAYIESQDLQTVGPRSPASAADMQRVVEISAGEQHNLAIRADGTLWAWGNNSGGRPGLNTIGGQRTTPAQVGSATNWQSVSAGTQHSLGIQSDGTLWAWGANSFGRTGLGLTAGATTTPTQVGSATNWQSVSAGGSHSLAITTNGQLWAWGANTAGQTGLGTNSGNQIIPAQVGSATNWQSVATGWQFSVGTRTDGTLWAWGNNFNGRTGLNVDTGLQLTPAQVGSATNWQSVSAGDAHSLAITSNGQLWAWGNNDSGRTGFGISTGNQIIPVQVGSATNWQSASAGNNHSLAITTNGQLWAWGNNGSGRTGFGDNTGLQLTPAQVGSATNWQSVSAGGAHSLAITTNGQIWSWGGNANGELGKGFRTTAPYAAPATSHWVPWRIASSMFPAAGLASNWSTSDHITEPRNNAVDVSLGTDSIVVRFDREMRTDVVSRGTIVLNNGATVNVAAGTWSDGWLVDSFPSEVPNSVFTAPLELVAPNTVHTVTISGFIDASFGLRATSEMYNHTWTFTTGAPGLEISKLVSGRHADLDTRFIFDLVLTGSTVPASMTAHVYNTQRVPTALPVATGRTVAITNGQTPPAGFFLYHNEKLVLRNLPAGVNFQVTERAVPEFHAAVSVLNAHDQTVLHTASNQNSNTALNTGSPRALPGGGALVSFTNTTVTPPPSTGLSIVDSASLVFIAASALTATVLLIAKSRNRKRSEESTVTLQ